MNYEEVYQDARDILSNSIMFKFVADFNHRYDILQFMASFSQNPYIKREWEVKEKIYQLANNFINYSREELGLITSHSTSVVVSIILTSIYNNDPVLIEEVFEDKINNFVMVDFYHLFSDCRMGNCYPYISDSENIFFSIQNLNKDFIKKIDAEVIKNGLMQINK